MPSPMLGQIYEKIIACQFNFRNKIKMMLLKDLMKKFICRAVFVQHKNRIAGQLAERDFLAF